VLHCTAKLESQHNVAAISWVGATCGAFKDVLGGPADVDIRRTSARAQVVKTQVLDIEFLADTTECRASGWIVYPHFTQCKVLF